MTNLNSGHSQADRTAQPMASLFNLLVRIVTHFATSDGNHNLSRTIVDNFKPMSLLKL